MRKTRIYGIIAALNSLPKVILDLVLEYDFYIHGIKKYELLTDINSEYSNIIGLNKQFLVYILFSQYPSIQILEEKNGEKFLYNEEIIHNIKITSDKSKLIISTFYDLYIYDLITNKFLTRILTTSIHIEILSDDNESLKIISVNTFDNQLSILTFNKYNNEMSKESYLIPNINGILIISPIKILTFSNENTIYSWDYINNKLCFDKKYKLDLNFRYDYRIHIKNLIIMSDHGHHKKYILTILNSNTMEKIIDILVKYLIVSLSSIDDDYVIYFTNICDTKTSISNTKVFILNLNTYETEEILTNYRILKFYTILPNKEIVFVSRFETHDSIIIYNILTKIETSFQINSKISSLTLTSDTCIALLTNNSIIEIYE